MKLALVPNMAVLLPFVQFGGKMEAMKHKSHLVPSMVEVHGTGLNS